jgi:hypothetical protein
MKTSLQFSATKPVNLGFKTFSLVSQDGQKFTPTGGTVLESATAVPNWLRDDTTRTLFGMKTSLMTSLFVWNIIGVVAHLSLAIITIAVAAIENPGGLDLNLPALPVYVTTMNTTMNIRNTMINNTTMNNTTMNTTMNFDLVFDKTWVDPLPLGWLTVSFFLLSAFFHGFSVFTSMFDYFNWAKPGFLPGLWGSYFYHIANCYNPGRWIEYSFSASTMILTIAISSFVRDVYLVFALWTLTFCTMTYGWVTEVINTAEPTKGRPQLWKLHSGSDDLVVPSFLAPLQRLVPHMIGYVPYACVWIVCFWGSNHTSQTHLIHPYHHIPSTSHLTTLDRRFFCTLSYSTHTMTAAIRGRGARQIGL